MRSPVAPRVDTRPLQHRKSIYRLDEQQIADFRTSINSALSIQDERGYHHHAGLHGLPLPSHCTHGDILFLPWHRAYLYFFELALRDQVPTVSLPWWDWSSESARTSGIPEAYAVESVNGERNPLYSVNIPEAARQQASQSVPQGPPTETYRQPREPGELPTSEEIEDILRAPNFLDFSNRLENVHGQVHVWVGGTMAEIAWAAYDPLFWAHHTIIDRLWRLWQLRNPEFNLDPGLLRQPLPPFNMTVEDTLDVTALGYEYASSTRHAVTGGNSGTQ